MGICSPSPGIQVSYGDKVVLLDTFRGDVFPRQVIDGVDVNFSATGTHLMSGSSRPQRLIWTISTMVRKADGWEFADLFKLWDTDRAQGTAAVIVIKDETNIRPGSDPILANAVFSAVPQFSPGVGADFTWIDFGLTEVS